jgi:hypothetical protein
MDSGERRILSQSPKQSQNINSDNDFGYNIHSRASQGGDNRLAKPLKR